MVLVRAWSKNPGISLREMRREARWVCSSGGVMMRDGGRGNRINGKIGFEKAMQATRISVLVLLASMYLSRERKQGSTMISEIEYLEEHP